MSEVEGGGGVLKRLLWFLVPLRGCNIIQEERDEEIRLTRDREKVENRERQRDNDLEKDRESRREREKEREREREREREIMT